MHSLSFQCIEGHIQFTLHSFITEKKFTMDLNIQVDFGIYFNRPIGMGNRTLMP